MTEKECLQNYEHHLLTTINRRAGYFMAGTIFTFLLVFIIVALLASSIKVVSEWERLAILTLGKFAGIKGPGLIIIIPIIQTVASRIDTRVQTTRFQSETTLTKDGVAVTIQAVLFWKVVDTKMATLQVADYRMAVELAAQTSLRDAVGKMNLPAILSNLDVAFFAHPNSRFG